ncbi:MAG: Gfo/Idh/MocA family oxidoreductase [Gammaproteobacteria bacterium]|nr:MAG: Gfo/Idh/MocA family oxidoreductase [Gammaproteobacteria bacterium]
MGMVGGGEGAFIGPVHRMAAELDGEIELVCGAFASDPERSMRSGRDIYRLARERCYPDYEEMFAVEAARPPQEQMQFVVIATPNHIHYPVAKAALEAGFHVVCDKPVTHRLEEAEHLAELVSRSGLLFVLTHNYTGYPMVKEARNLVRSGAFGSIRRVVCEYLQGWLAEDVSNKQADWRTDPERAGVAGCFGDIGSHGENLLEYVTDLKIVELCADLSSFVPGRQLDDDGNVLLRFGSGAKGILFASQVAVGEENGLRLRVYGERGGLEWSQTEPNSLIVRWPDRPYEVRRTGGSGLSAAALNATRLPAGHPEGYLEAFAVLYRNFASALRATLSGTDPNPEMLDFPTIDDGVRGMRFISAVVTSSARGGQWMSL